MLEDGSEWVSGNSEPTSNNEKEAAELLLVDHFMRDAALQYNNNSKASYEALLAWENNFLADKSQEYKDKYECVRLASFLFGSKKDQQNYIDIIVKASALFFVRHVILKDNGEISPDTKPTYKFSEVERHGPPKRPFIA